MEDNKYAYRFDVDNYKHRDCSKY